MQHLLRYVSLITAAVGIGSAALAEQDAQTIRPHESPITNATSPSEKLARCADLFTTLIAAPLGFGNRKLPDNLESALAIAQEFDTTRVYMGTAIALAFPDAADMGTILRDLGKGDSAFVTALERVTNPTEVYFFNLSAEIEAYEDQRTIPSIVSADVATCHPVTKAIVAQAPDANTLFELQASKMERWAGALRIPISKDLPIRVGLQRCGALLYASSTGVEEIDGEWKAVPIGGRGLVYFAMKAVKKPIDKVSFRNTVQLVDGPVRDALVEMAEMTHRYVKTLGFENAGPDRQEFSDVLQQDREYCAAHLRIEIGNLDYSDIEWPILQGLPLVHETGPLGR